MKTKPLQTVSTNRGSQLNMYCIFRDRETIREDYHFFFFLLAVFVLKTHASQGTCNLKKKVRTLSYARMALTGSKVACIKIRVFNILDYTPRIAKTNMKQFHLITKFVFVPFVCSFIYDFYFLFPSFRFHF